MAFKGVFDQSIGVRDAREQRDLQAHLARMQIKAQERMEKMRLAQSQAQFEAQERGVQSRFEQSEQRLQSQFDRTDDREERKFARDQERYDAGAEMRKLTEDNARLMYEKTMRDFQEDQAQREALTNYRRSAFGAGVLSAMQNGVVSVKSISDINKALGVVDGEIGSIASMWGGPEGVSYAVVGQDEQGNPRRIEQKVSPIEILTLARGQFGEQFAKDWIEIYKANNRENNEMNKAIDALNRELEKHKFKMEVEQFKSELRSQREAESAKHREEAAAVRQSPLNIEALNKKIERGESELKELKAKKPKRLTDEDKVRIEELERDQEFYKNALKKATELAYGMEVPLTRAETEEKIREQARNEIKNAVYDEVTGELTVYFKNATAEKHTNADGAKEYARWLKAAGVTVN